MPHAAHRRLLVVAGLMLAALSSCRREPAPSRRAPLFVIGIDGAEWKVIHRLWSAGKLPHLRSLADRGVTATLKTEYNSSPVIWTTIATGVRPKVHGITDFVVPSEAGDVPVSSAARKVPALWNMATRAGRRVAVLGWWASWPAEPVNGLVLSDRSLLPLAGRIYPESYLPELERDLASADAAPGGFARSEPERQDRLMARTAAKLADDRFDLLLLYIRSLDVVSHHSWKGFEPEAFPGAAPAELDAARNEVSRIYEAVDREIGQLLVAVPKNANVLVLSDHGFHAAKREELRVWLDFDVVLQRLGYLHRGKQGVDFTRSRIYTYGSPAFRRSKMLRFALAGREPGGSVLPAARDGLRRRLAADLERVTNDHGESIFSLRAARPRRGEEGDLAVLVTLHRVTPTLRVDGKPLAGAVGQISHLSGTHTPSTHGVFLAAGPDIDPRAKLEGIHVHDMAPTILYALGLPVGEDFAGRAWTELYTDAFRRSHPPRRIASWGRRESAGGDRRSASDEKLLDDLRSLGYIQ